MPRKEDSTWFPKPKEPIRQKDLSGVVLNGQYRIQHKISAGAMGVLYRAEQISLRRDVAIKIVWGVKHPVMKRRFEQEAHCAGLLSSPFSVRVFEVGYEQRLSIHYIVMEYLDGCSVDEWVRIHGSMPEHLGLRLLWDGARAVQAMEKEAIVHRDIKPSNLFFVNRSSFKLIDFGLAKTKDSIFEEEYEGLVGTPMYVSPEQLQTRQADSRSDIYSLGMSLIFALSGEVPYPNMSMDSLLNAQRTARPEKLLSLPFEAVLEKMVCKDPKKRFQSATEILLALSERLEGNVLKLLFQASIFGR